MLKITAQISIIWLATAATGMLNTPLEAQTTEVVLHSFGCPPRGANPVAGVMRDAKGNLYGTTMNGGPANVGVVYKLNTAGQQTVLYSFTGGADGTGPASNLIIDSAGNLYGTAGGGASGMGVVYKLDNTGHQTVLYNFSGGADGGNVRGGVIRDSAGNLYGATYNGGAANAGVVYKLDITGHETVLYSFGGGADGAWPDGGVIRDSAGNLYGTTLGGGSADLGTVYKVDTSGHESVLHSFAGGTDGVEPQFGVTRDSAGNLYGATLFGGNDQSAGIVYKLDATGHETVLYTFTGGLDGLWPSDGVILDSAGNLYGTTSNGGSGESGVVYKVDTGGHETVLYNFAVGAGGFSGGSATLVFDSAGNLYGTTQFGDVANTGVVYELDAAGQATVLYSFPGDAGGADPSATLAADSAGNLYGTAYSGGPANVGVVYKLDPKGNETVLHNFAGGNDGSGPYAGVTRDTAGNIYGTTVYGGPANAGVVYKLDPAGNETVLYNFTGGADGANPYAGVILDSEGNLYGTTYSGGPASAGVVYELDPAGHETVLYSFTGGDDGAHPYAGVIRDSGGNLYGTAADGGQSGAGVVYKLDATGHQTVLLSFDITDGAAPYAGVIRDSAGNFYGTTVTGGPWFLGEVYKLNSAGQVTVLALLDDPTSGVIRDSAGNLYGTSKLSSGAGLVYKVDASGNYSVLYNFSGGTDGNAPIGGLIRDAAGHLYGTTSYGGTNNSGVVFRLQ